MFEKIMGALLVLGNAALLGSTAPEMAVITVFVLGIAALVWPVADLVEAVIA